MINLADNGLVCDCGSAEVVPAIISQPGELCICATCAQASRVEARLVPVTWSTVETHFAERPHDLCAFTWHRNGVHPSRRRTLPEIQASASSRLAERLGTIGGLVVVLCLMALIVRAVIR